MITAKCEEKNKADYIVISNNIEKILNLMETDLNIPATEISLAKLAGCSRGTLRNRRYPLERLKAIKKRRAEQLKRGSNVIRISSAHRIAVEVHIDEKKALRLQVEKSRSETAVWVENHTKLARENRRLSRHVDVLIRGKTLLEKRVEELEGQLGERESTRKTESNIFLIKG